ncbi:hypothetical protein [Phnomibacter ginsenosidimutans]|uniref:hypothetical protein n=1 Tax=Phnomibacter ginsenosidimutans TaxID=2676868 RepID=UPI0018D21D48|nr:hypothetical protein [Phnomibacter ginsenosidimutans]
MILIMQMQGASVNTTNTTAYGEITSYNNAGLYEFACVSAVPGTTSITVTLPLMNAYSASGNTQVIRVPRFTSLTVATVGSIVAPAWNGATGGVVAIETTGSIALSTASAINVSGRGFRGGALDNNSSTAGSGPITTYRSTSGNDGAEKGESIAGSATAYDVLNGRYGRGAIANGGGGGYIGITSGTPARTVAGGANGTTTSTAVTEFTPNGATVGAGGSLLTYNPVSSLFIPVSGTVLNDANG